eukprot:GHVQ01020251.1.p2 GENE.GHVQ01020251.1~~GHVQ01020251.1.p2  ORF type:complete len:110 (-),score=21.42 GHVQ01020251.1:548-877(-)
MRVHWMWTKQSNGRVLVYTQVRADSFVCTFLSEDELRTDASVRLFVVFVCKFSPVSVVVYRHVYVCVTVCVCVCVSVCMCVCMFVSVYVLVDNVPVWKSLVGIVVFVFS